MKKLSQVALTILMLSWMQPARSWGQQSLKLWPVGSEFQVNAFTLYDQERPAVAAQANGDFVVVWQYLEEPFIFTGIKGRRFDSAGQPVGTEFQVNTFTTSYYGQRPAVTADADGDFVVVWDDTDTLGAYEIYGRRYNSAGVVQGPDFIINSDTTYYQYNARASVAPTGDFVVVWNTGLLGSGTYSQYAFARRYDSAGIPVGSQFQINTSGDYYGDKPDAGVAANGDFVVMWNGWFQPFDSSYDEYSGVFARKYDSSGNPLTTDLHVNAYTTDNQYGSVAVERDGDFIVIWSSIGQDGDQSGIYGQRYDSAGGVSGTEFGVNVYTTGSQETPAVAVDGKGNFVVVWNSYDGQDGDFNGIFGRAYNSLGTPLAYTTNGTSLGTEFQANTYTTDAQRRPAVAAGGNGEFVVVWDSYYDQDGSYEGVFGQRFVVAYEVQNQSAGSGDTVSTELGPPDPVGTSAADPMETYVTTPNAGTVTIVEKANGGSPPSGYGFLGQQVSISAPAASTSNPLKLVFQIDNSLRPGSAAQIAVSRNGVCVPNCIGVVTTNLTGCPGGPTTVAPEPCASPCNPCEASACVANRCTTSSGVQLTVLTAAASDWNLAVPVCPPNPDLSCTTGFAKGLLLVKDDVPGKEKLIAKLIGGLPIAQSDFGDPLTSDGTTYNFCIYDDAGTLVGSTRVARAGDTTCSGGSVSCWKPIGGAPPNGKGYKYTDTDKTDGGVAKILLKGGASSGKILFKAKGPSPPFPQGIPAALMSATSVTLQVRGDDAPTPSCFSIALTDIKKQEPGTFKAK